MLFLHKNLKKPILKVQVGFSFVFMSHEEKKYCQETENQARNSISLKTFVENVKRKMNCSILLPDLVHTVDTFQFKLHNYFP